MTALSHIVALCSLGIRSLPQRLGSSVSVIIGVAGVIAILLSVLAISGSLARAIAGAGHPARAIVLHRGAESEAGSFIERGAVARIQTAPGVRRASDGKPIASADVLTRVHLIEASKNSRAEALVRGVGPAASALRPEIEVVAGRRMRPGFYELMAGASARSHFADLDLGHSVAIRGTDWLVVGIFESDGDARESELLTDAETLLSVIGRNAFNSVSVLLETPEAFPSFRDALALDTSLSVHAYQEPVYLRHQSERLRETWSFVAYVASGIMAIGAMFGAANTMYSSVSARSIEIATLRAIGFGPTAVVASILFEALVLAIVGALLGTFVVWLLFSGDEVSTRLGAGRVVAKLSLDAALVALGIAWACAISILGGLLPALRAATQPVAQALRED